MNAEKLPAPTVPQLAMNGRGIQLQGLQDLLTMSRMILASGFAPAGFKTEVSVAVAVQYGLEVGLTPMSALQNICVINGRPCIYGDGGTALVRASGKLGQVRETFEGQGDETTAVCELERIDGGRVTKILGTFSIADAKRAKLWEKSGPWASFPKRMLMWRARTYAYRDGFADVLKGLTFREEAEDLEPREVQDLAPATLSFAPAGMDLPAHVEEARAEREVVQQEEVLF